jgi:hypothetical protein
VALVCVTVISGGITGVGARYKQNNPRVMMMMMSLICSTLPKQKIGAKLHIYLQEGTYHARLFRGPSTNDMKT